MRIEEIPSSDRPREKLASRGPGSLTDAELLAIFLRTGRKGHGAVALAAELIASRGSLLGLSRASAADLQQAASGIGPAKAAELAAAFELGKRLARGSEERPLLNEAEAIYDHFGPEFQALGREELKVVLLDTKLRMILAETISRGSLNECVAYARDIVRSAVVHSAYGLIVIHNHPSGDPAPSPADQRLTKRLAEAAELLQIQFLDHVIIGTREGKRSPFFSFREAGLL